MENIDSIGLFLTNISEPNISESSFIFVSAAKISTVNTVEHVSCLILRIIIELAFSETY